MEQSERIRFADLEREVARLRDELEYLKGWSRRAIFPINPSQFYIDENGEHTAALGQDRGLYTQVSVTDIDGNVIEAAIRKTANRIEIRVGPPREIIVLLS